VAIPALLAVELELEAAVGGMVGAIAGEWNDCHAIHLFWTMPDMDSASCSCGGHHPAGGAYFSCAIEVDFNATS